MVFSGIIQSIGVVTNIVEQKDLLNLEVKSDSVFSKDLNLGGSVCVDGVCLTVVSIDANRISFDIIMETLNSTTLKKIKLSDEVNLERSLKFGDEIGGHILSGHVSETLSITNISNPENNHIISFKASEELMKYVFPKGYIAINGVSLTVGKVSVTDNTFNVYLIPETLSRTNLSRKEIGDLINVEIDSQTRNTVDTITKITKEHINA